MELTCGGHKTLDEVAIKKEIFQGVSSFLVVFVAFCTAN